LWHIVESSLDVDVHTKTSDDELEGTRNKGSKIGKILSDPIPADLSGPSGVAGSMD